MLAGVPLGCVAVRLRCCSAGPLLPPSANACMLCRWCWWSCCWSPAMAAVDMLVSSSTFAVLGAACSYLWSFNVGRAVPAVLGVARGAWLLWLCFSNCCARLLRATSWRLLPDCLRCVGCFPLSAPAAGCVAIGCSFSSWLLLALLLLAVLFLLLMAVARFVFTGAAVSL